MMNGPQRTKALPPRPSQDLGYGGLQNGYRKENMDPRNFGSQNGRKPSMQEPSRRMILQGYGSEISNSFEQSPRYNPVSELKFSPKERKDWMSWTLIEI